MFKSKILTHASQLFMNENRIYIENKQLVIIMKLLSLAIRVRKKKLKPFLTIRNKSSYNHGLKSKKETKRERARGLSCLVNVVSLRPFTKKQQLVYNKMDYLRDNVASPNVSFLMNYERKRLILLIFR